MTRLLDGRRRDPRTGRGLFARVANRALEPGSKLAAACWLSGCVHIEGLTETSDDELLSAMDWLIEIAAVTSAVGRSPTRHPSPPTAARTWRLGEGVGFRT